MSHGAKVKGWKRKSIHLNHRGSLTVWFSCPALRAELPQEGDDE